MSSVTGENIDKVLWTFKNMVDKSREENPDLC